MSVKDAAITLEIPDHITRPTTRLMANGVNLLDLLNVIALRMDVDNDGVTQLTITCWNSVNYIGKAEVILKQGEIPPEDLPAIQEMEDRQKKD